MSEADRGSVAGEWRQGWPTVLWTTGAIASGIGLLTITASYFVKPLAAATGWTRAEIAFGTSLSQFGIAFVLPFIGAAADRIGIRRVSAISAIVYGLLCFAMLVVPATLPVYYAMLLLLALGASGTSTAVLAQLVAERFKRWRGTVLGIAISGPAILLVPIAPLMVMATNDISWRAGYAILGAISFIVGLPSILLAVRYRPARNGSRADIHAPAGAGDDEAGLALGQAMRTPAYWMLVGATLFSTLPLGGFLHQLSAMLSDKGLSVAEVGSLASVYVAMIFVGRAGAGLLLDVLNPSLTVMGVMFAAAGGSLLLLDPHPSLLACALAAGLVGNAMGGEGSIQGFFIARSFGLRAFSAIFGTIGACTVIGFGVGALIFGRLYDVNGDYRVALLLSAAGFAASGILFGTVGRRRKQAATFPPLAVAEAE